MALILGDAALWFCAIRDGLALARTAWARTARRDEDFRNDLWWKAKPAIRACFFGPSERDYEIVTDHSVSLVSLLIAAVVAGVGFLQWRTARLQWLAAHNRQAFDLFDKRYEIYRVFRGAVGKVMAGSGRLPLELSVKIREASEESRFLFGDDVVKYLSRFIEDLDSLDARVAELEESRGQERKTNIDQQRYFRDRIEQFRTEGVSLFAQYIRFDQKIKTTYFGR